MRNSKHYLRTQSHRHHFIDRLETGIRREMVFDWFFFSFFFLSFFLLFLFVSFVCLLFCSSSFFLRFLLLLLFVLFFVCLFLFSIYSDEECDLFS